MKILLLGAHGQLGEALGVVLPKETTQWGRDELDLTHREDIAPRIRKIHPDMVINAAAMTDVDACETKNALAVEINGEAPGALAKVCKEMKSLLVHISTDYVFGGDELRQTPYRETDLPNPINAYGHAKLGGEENIKKSGCEYLIVRTSGLYGKDGAGANYVSKVLLQGMQKELRATTDQVYSPTWVGEFAPGLWKLMQQKQRGIVHLVNTGAVSRYDFTKAIIEISGLSTRIVPTRRSDFDTSAKRPAYSVMTSERIDLKRYMSDWRKALQLHLKDLRL